VVSLAAAAMRTERIRLGTMLTPFPSASLEAGLRNATLDNLSGGRVILSIGLARWIPGLQFWRGDGPQDPRRIDGRGTGNPYRLWRDSRIPSRVSTITCALQSSTHPPPVQRPRIPIWVWAHTRAENPCSGRCGLMDCCVQDGCARQVCRHDPGHHCGNQGVYRRKQGRNVLMISSGRQNAGDEPARAAEIGPPWLKQV